MALCRRQLLYFGTYLTKAAVSDSAGYHITTPLLTNSGVGAAGKLYIRLYQMFESGTRFLNRSFPVLLLVLLTEGQTVQVTGTDLTITVRSVRDFTSEGCLRGPIGCLDNVQLEITRSNLSQQIVLATPHTELQSDKRVARTNVFGHEITLVSLKNKQVVLNVDK